MPHPIFFSRQKKLCKICTKNLKKKNVSSLPFAKGFHRPPPFSRLIRASASLSREGSRGALRRSVLAGRRSCRFLSLAEREPAVLPVCYIPARQDSLSVFRSSRRETSGAPCRAAPRHETYESAVERDHSVVAPGAIIAGPVAFEFDLVPISPMCRCACMRACVLLSLSLAAREFAFSAKRTAFGGNY